MSYDSNSNKVKIKPDSVHKLIFTQFVYLKRKVPVDKDARYWNVRCSMDSQRLINIQYHDSAAQPPATHFPAYLRKYVIHFNAFFSWIYWLLKKLLFLLRTSQVIFCLTDNAVYKSLIFLRVHQVNMHVNI